MTTAIVIPARLASTRLAHKMLLAQTGKPLIQHTYEQAKKSKLAEHIIIATDNHQIADIALGFGAEVAMTKPEHPTGTDRLAEVAVKYLANRNINIIINVQGDEPEVDPNHIDALIRLFQHSDAAVGTLVTRFNNGESPRDPNIVKAVLGAPIAHDKQDNPLGYQALYFSRALIPFPRETQGVPVNNSDYFMHLGLYAYRYAFLQKFATLPQGILEKTEKLEQLRVLENGYQIIASIVEKAMPGIDTLEDYQKFVARWKAAHCIVN